MQAGFGHIDIRIMNIIPAIIAIFVLTRVIAITMFILLSLFLGILLLLLKC